MNLRIAACVAALFLGACASAGSERGSSGQPWKTYTLQSGGVARSYGVVSPERGSGPYPVLVFLHGLDDSDPKPQVTLQQYRFLAAKARSLGFIAVFPRGLPGINAALPASLGWSGDPELERANHRFLLALVQDLESRYPVSSDRLILAGYENGAYFVSRELTMHPDTPFKGFWCDSGGEWVDYVEIYGRLPRVALTVSNDDWLDLKNVRGLRDQLLDHGWSQDSNLLFILRPTGGGLDESDFPAVWRFLTTSSS